jgi:hypothetical protein
VWQETEGVRSFVRSLKLTFSLFPDFFLFLFRAGRVSAVPVFINSGIAAPDRRDGRKGGRTLSSRLLFVRGSRGSRAPGN